MTEPKEQTTRQRKGFACMTPERRREIAGMGGRKAHELGKAHQYTLEQAREAGRLGGVASGLARRKKKEVATEQVAQ